MSNNRYVRLGLGALAVVVFLQILGVNAGSIVLVAVVLACPLMMFFMMRGMSGPGKGSDHHDHADRQVGTPDR